MGYEREVLEKIVNVIKAEFAELSGIEFLELGNQEVYNNYDRVLQFYSEYGYTHKMERTIVKPFYEFLGLKCTQIDYNGRDGALALDVRNDVTSHFNKKFKLLTNVGFTEHVGEGDSDRSQFKKSQYSVFKNLHDLGDIGAVYYHCVPLNHYWHKHGICDYSLEFFEKLCIANNYVIIKEPYVENYHVDKQASVFYRKINNYPFMTYEQFAALPGLRSTAND